MIRIAVVEDDDQYASTLLAFLKQFEKESGQAFKVTRFQDGADIVARYAQQFDLILMDIEMEKMDGMTAAEAIRRVDRDVVIIFITNMMHYAMKGYEVEAFDYVLKPINYYAFSQRLTRALERMVKRKSKVLFVSHYGNLKKISTDQLKYIEIHNHNIEYHTTSDILSTRGTLKEMEQELAGFPFFRCNSGCLVNLDYVSELRQNEILIGDEWLPISRTRKKAFLDAMNTYLNEVSK